VSPIEALIADNLPNPLRWCPRCRRPFSPFMRGQVTRFGWFGLRRRVWALICWACKDIVGWEAIERC